MTTSLSVTTQLSSTKKLQVTCHVVAGGTLPLDIFIYENTGTATLGAYIGICNLAEYQRLKTFHTGDIIPKFGNKFVKFTEARIELDVEDNPERVIHHLTNTATFLSFELSNSTAVTKLITIP